jgi:plastocyanin
MKTAVLLWLLLLPPVAAAGTEVVIEASALTPPVLTVAADDVVVFVNRSGRIVHVDFFGRTGEHHVFQVPGSIRAIFHRAGRHPYVVHLGRDRREEMRGAVDVEEPREPRGELPVCRGITVEGNCLEP